MKLAISNIAWPAINDDSIYRLMLEHGYSGLEIAPTRILSTNPYDNLFEAKNWVQSLNNRYGFGVPSMQSIWFGRQEKIFASPEERRFLLDYTKKAIDFAEAIGCGNLVFGCPKNRNLTDSSDESIAIAFFKELGDYAFKHGTIIGMEANPVIYNTNYINDTTSAINLIKKVDSPGFFLNLDVGTMVENEEKIDELAGNVYLINHVHISEPGLSLIRKRKLHKKLYQILKAENYAHFISIEMGKQEDVSLIGECLQYVKEIFG